MLLQLHISERTGRGVPKITEVYGKETYEFRENSIVVSIPFTRVQMEENTQVDLEMTYDNVKMTYDNVKMTYDKQEMTHDRSQSTYDEYKNDEERILEFCIVPRTIHEIMDILCLKERKSARRHIKPLVECGRLSMTLPNKPKSKNQKYITIK